MADKKISDLPTTGTAALADEVETNTAGAAPSVRRTLAQIIAAAYVNTPPTLGWYSPSADTIRTPNSVIIDDTLTVSGTGPHAIGGAVSTNVQWYLTGSFTGASNARALHIDSTIIPAVGGDATGLSFGMTMNKAGSGTHADFATMFVQPPTINAGAATLTNATTLKVTGAPSVGTNKRAFWVAAGDSQLDGNLTVAAPSVTSGVRIGQLSDATTWGMISFNGVYTNAGHVGMNGGGGGSTSLSINVPTGGTISQSVNASTVTAASATGLAVTGTLSASSNDATTYAALNYDSENRLVAKNTNTTTNATAGLYLEVGTNAQAGITAIRIGDGITAMAFGVRFGGIRTEVGRFMETGHFKASEDGTYINAGGAYHELRSSQAGSTLYLSNKNASNPYGIAMEFTAAAPDNNTNYFLYCADNSATRCYIYSDGDVVNHDGTYGTISDGRLKTDWQDARDYTVDFMQIEIGTFMKKGAKRKNIGAIADQVKTVFPGLVPTVRWNDEDVLALRESVLYGPIMATVVQSLVRRVQTLEQQNNG